MATLIGKLKVGSRLYSLYSQKVKESLDSLSLLVGGVRVYPSYEEEAKAGELSFKLGNKVWHLRESAPPESEHHNDETWKIFPKIETKHFSNETIYVKLLDRVAKVNFIGTGDAFIDAYDLGNHEINTYDYHFFMTNYNNTNIAIEIPDIFYTDGEITRLDASIIKEYSGPLVGEITLNLS